MGQEISSSQFSARDFKTFSQRLRLETALLERWWQQGRFHKTPHVAGFEIEAWLLDQQGSPSPRNKEFIDSAEDLLVFPELAQFNIELNSIPRQLSGDVFSQMHTELSQTWDRCGHIARSMGNDLLMIGILPTVQESELNLKMMSEMQRYRAINQQVLRMRAGRPIELNIKGCEQLHLSHRDVMLESATTSLQLHLQVSPEKAAAYYNAAHIVSAPMVAVSANSPFLFGKQLWDETRIPLFEQSVAVPNNEQCMHSNLNRVSFGSGYLQNDLMECFRENAACFPPLLPIEVDKYPAALSHLRLHNGTIWRWNRPLVGFDYDGSPHLRIEHRVMSAGPSVVDTIANAAFFYGLCTDVAEAGQGWEEEISFSLAKDNFYAAARYGLEAEVVWLGGLKGNMQQLVIDHMLPAAKRGLMTLEIAEDDIEHYLGIIEQRVLGLMNGACWQRSWVSRLRKESVKGDSQEGVMQALVQGYLKQQATGKPVHEWDFF